MEMTLGKALRYKKRVVENIRNLEQDIQLSNCTVEGEERDTDVRLAVQQRSAWVKHLVNLKLAMQAATAPVQRLVLELAEVKSEISFLQRVNVTHGLSQSRYRDETSIKYNAIIRKSERDALITELQDKIDDLQSALESFNATNSITVTDPELP